MICMDCRQIEALLSLFNDGELNRSEAEAVRVHLATCASCGREYESMVQLSAACKSISDVMIPAPSGFKDSVMLRIANEEKLAAPIKPRNWFKRNWKQVAAGIAAGVLIIISTLSMNSGPILQVAQNPPAITDPGANSPQVDDPGNTVIPNDNTPATQSPGTEQDPDADPAVTPGETVTPGGYSPSVILANKDRFITTTVLRVKAANGDDALQRAMNMAAAADAQAQNLGQQINDNGSFLVLKIIVSKDEADNLINKLSSLGTVDSKEVNNNDITTQYSDKVNQYQTLVTQRATLQDTSQKAELDQRIKTIENELKDWEHKANQETIVLWLEK